MGEPRLVQSRRVSIAVETQKRSMSIPVDPGWEKQITNPYVEANIPLLPIILGIRLIRDMAQKARSGKRISAKERERKKRARP